MLEAIFAPGIDEIKVIGLTQWDKGQRLSIVLSDAPNYFQVHFAFEGGKEALMVDVQGNVAKIPDELLTQHRDLIAYVYELGSDGFGETIKTIHLPVTPRAKPEDYISEDITPSQMERLEAMIASVYESTVPITRKVNGKALSADITLSAADVSGVALNGSNFMTGNLVVKKVTPLVRLDDDAAGSSAMMAIANDQMLLQNIDVTGNDDNRRQLILRNASHATYPALSEAFLLNTVIGKAQKSYRIYGEHNKPSGSYTGNGSATQRTIDVGGIGEVVIIYSGSGVEIVTRRDRAEAAYSNGVLTIASTANSLNANGVTYYYQVL